MENSGQWFRQFRLDHFKDIGKWLHGIDDEAAELVDKFFVVGNGHHMLVISRFDMFSLVRFA